MQILTEEEVAARAQRWARFHGNIKYRDKMDEVLEGLSKADQRRVYLCGQRMVAGLPLKVLPAATGKEATSAKANKAEGRQPATAGGGSGANQKQASVGAARVSPKGRHSRKSASGSE
jgi:hypothetical protein